MKKIKTVTAGTSSNFEQEVNELLSKGYNLESTHVMPSNIGHVFVAILSIEE